MRKSITTLFMLCAGLCCAIFGAIATCKPALPKIGNTNTIHAHVAHTGRLKLCVHMHKVMLGRLGSRVERVIDFEYENTILVFEGGDFTCDTCESLAENTDLPLVPPFSHKKDEHKSTHVIASTCNFLKNNHHTSSQTDDSTPTWCFGHTIRRCRSPSRVVV